MNNTLLKKSIILIDFDNEHGQKMYALLKNPFNQGVINNVIWEKIESISDIAAISFRYRNAVDRIFCIPLAWEDDTYNHYISILTMNNIVIASKDDELLYPWSLDSVHCASKSVTVESSVNGQGFTLTGTSPYSAIMAIVALNGRSQLKRIEEL